jgi:phosphate-selective porin OprO and OprP
MKKHWLSATSVVGLVVLWALGSEGLAEDSAPSKSQTVEERLSAIEGKLQALESRLDQALGSGGPRGNATASDSAEAPIADRLDLLDQKLQIVERKRELEAEATAAKLKESPVVTASGKDGFGFKSADSSFQLRVGGLVQADSRFYTEGDPARALGSSTFLLRKVRPVLEGTVYKYFDFKIMPDFGNGQALVQDAYLDFTYLPAAKVRFGKNETTGGLRAPAGRR